MTEFLQKKNCAAAKIYSIIKDRYKLVLSVALLMIIICSYFVYLQLSFRYNIQIFSYEVEQWEGWSIKYTLNELCKEYPEFLPFVSSEDTRLQIEHRRIGPGDTVLWEDGDGVYSFDDIYKKKRIDNYFHHLPCNAVMPHSYLRIDRRGYLKPEVGDNIRTGTYYINKWLPRAHQNDLNACEKQFAPYGFFIEIQKDGWRIAGYDMCKTDIISLDKSDNYRRIISTQHISPLLEFNKKYKLYEKAHQRREIIIVVNKDGD